MKKYIKKALAHYRLLVIAAKFELAGASSSESCRSGNIPIYLAHLAKSRPKKLLLCLAIIVTFFFGIAMPMFCSLVASQPWFSDQRWHDLPVNIPWLIKLIPWFIGVFCLQLLWDIYKEIRSTCRSQRLWKHVAEICVGMHLGESVWGENWQKERAITIELVKKTLPKHFWPSGLVKPKVRRLPPTPATCK